MIDISDSQVHQLGITQSPVKTKKNKWKRDRSDRKEAKQSGRAHKTVAGKLIPAKTFKFINCNCRYECIELPFIIREEIFESFWRLGNWQSQSNYIASAITICDPKIKTVPNSRKMFTRVYRFNEFRVCKDVFIGTLGISNGRLDYCIKTKSKSNMCSPDKRGKSRGNKTSEEKIAGIKEFLDNFPKYKSHYCENSKVYFSPDLNKQLLYDMYREKCVDFVGKTVFNKYFEEYNIGFYVPRVDTCKTCDIFNNNMKNTLDETCTREINQKQEEHIKRAEKVRKLLKESSELAKTDDSVLVLTFDMQKTAPLPRINTSIVFYKRQLWVYNVGIHNCKDESASMMVWLEGEARRGSQEVCSCIYKYLQDYDTEKIKYIKTFSDACGGQNKNKTIICFFMYCCNKFNVESWCHSYLESGHSYLPNDRDFGQIAKKAKNSCTIYDLDQWINIIKTARKIHPFHVTKMKGQFVNINALTSNATYNNKHTTSTDKFNFSKMTSFTVSKNSNIVQYTERGSDVVHSLTYPQHDVTELSLADTTCPISKEKYKDLMSLMSLIPNVYKDFYENLSH